MDGRSTTFALVLALASTGLAGCIENPDWFSNTSAEVSARENLGLADEAALAWSSEAVLVGVMGFELSESPDPRIDADPDPGNGLAPAWWYVYCSTEGEDSEVRAFKVASDGTVTSEADAEAFADGFDHAMAEKLGAWDVDSNAALATAKTDEGFAKVAQGFNATVVEGIAHYEGKTAWWVSAMSADGFVVATVDAVSGELLHVEAIDMDFTMPQFQWGAANPQIMAQPVHLEGEGAATRADEPAEFPFWIDGPMSGKIQIDYAAGSPMDGLHWAILDSEGEWIAGDHLRSWRGESAYVADLEIEDAGEYTLQILYMEMFPTPVASPLGGAVDYAFMLDLYPPGMEPEHEDHEE